MERVAEIIPSCVAPRSHRAGRWAQIVVSNCRGEPCSLGWMRRRMGVKPTIKKLLWDNAGGVCSFPFCYLGCAVPPTKEGDDRNTVEEVTHIISGKDKGPRGDSQFPRTQIDDLANLILLCPTDHRLVDKQERAFNAGRLLQWKREHEGRVAKFGKKYFKKARQDLRETIRRSGGICAEPKCGGTMPPYAPGSYFLSVTFIEIATLPSLLYRNLVILCPTHKNEAEAKRNRFRPDLLRDWKSKQEDAERMAADYDRELSIDAE